MRLRYQGSSVTLVVYACILVFQLCTCFRTTCLYVLGADLQKGFLWLTTFCIRTIEDAHLKTVADRRKSRPNFERMPPRVEVDLLDLRSFSDWVPEGLNTKHDYPAGTDFT
jgi:hypothetical protein